MSTAYYRGAQACILAFDVTDRSSFDGEGGGIRGWLEEVRKENQASHLCIFLVGLKCDLKDHRQVQMSEGIALAKEIGAEYWEVSSKEDINVKELFDRVAVQSFEQSLEKAVAVSSQSAVTTDERVREETATVTYVNRDGSVDVKKADGSTLDYVGRAGKEQFEWESQVPALCAGVAASPSLTSVSTTFGHARAVIFLTPSLISTMDT